MAGRNSGGTSVVGKVGRPRQEKRQSACICQRALPRGGDFDG